MSNDDFRPPHVHSDQPLDWGRDVTATAVAEYFLWAAKTFRNMDRDEWHKDQSVRAARGERHITEASLKDDCGRQIMYAHEWGLLSDWPQLGDLATWHSQPIKRMGYVRCPSNLFLDFCGGGIVRCKIVRRPDGSLVPIPEKDASGRTMEFGGLLPRINRGHLNLPKYERFAQACERLAELVNQGKDAASASRAAPAGSPTDDATFALLSVFTNGVSDERIATAAQLLRDNTLTATEKLTKIDGLLRIPATASAARLAKMLSVTKRISKAGVIRTAWWKNNRKGEKASEIGRRRAVHRERAKEHETPRAKDDSEHR